MQVYSLCITVGGEFKHCKGSGGLSIPPGIPHYLHKSHISGSSLGRASFSNFDYSGPWIKFTPYKASGSIKKCINANPTKLNLSKSTKSHATGQVSYITF